MRKVLVADDEESVRLSLRRLLTSSFGCEVIEAQDGVSAVEVLTTHPELSLAVVDINMPKMDGYTFVRELRRLGHVPQAPVLMVSTESQTQDATAAQDAGANCYLIKPARPAELVLTAALMLGDAPAAAKAAQMHLSNGGR